MNAMNVSFTVTPMAKRIIQISRFEYVKAFNMQGRYNLGGNSPVIGRSGALDRPPAEEDHMMSRDLAGCRRPTSVRVACAGLAIAIIASIALAPTDGFAQARIDSLSMTCAALKDVIQKRGVVIVGTGPNVYDRYVANGRFCAPTQITDNGFVPTSDNRQCAAGYLCRERTFAPFK